MNIKDNEFIEELVNNKVAVSIFLRNGYQMKGWITRLYGDFLKFSSIYFYHPYFIRYSFISTIKVLEDIGAGGKIENG